MIYNKMNEEVSVNKFVLISLGSAFSTVTQGTTINVPFLVKRINIKQVLYQDNTSSYVRTWHALYSSLFNNDCISFINNSTSPFQPLNSGTMITYNYENPITVAGNYVFFLRDFLGNYVVPLGAGTGTTQMMLYLEFIGDKKTN